MNDFAKNAEKLYTHKISREEVIRVINDFFNRSIKENEEKSARQETMIANNIQRFMSAYDADDNQNFIGTELGLFNAASDFYTHKPISDNAKSEDSRFLAVTFDPKLLMCLMNFANSKVA